MSSSVVGKMVVRMRHLEFITHNEDVNVGISVWPFIPIRDTLIQFLWSPHLKQESRLKWRKDIDWKSAFLCFRLEHSNASSKQTSERYSQFLFFSLIIWMSLLFVPYLFHRTHNPLWNWLVVLYNTLQAC